MPLALAERIALDLHADVADWNSVDGFERFLAVGTYELDEKTQVRHGKLYAYEVQGDAATASLKLKHTVHNLPGIFDLHFTSLHAVPGSEMTVTMALADGSVRLVDACHGMESATSGEDPAAMALTVDTLVSPASSSTAASYSDGSIKIFDITPDGRLELARSWAAHSLEAWMATWSRAPARRGNVIYCGGDDAVFQAYDLRETGHPARLFLDKRTHGAGVTCIGELNELNENTVITGSYDNQLRIWDWRHASRPLEQKAFDMGGGVWRLKPHPGDPTVLLAATMYDGFKIVKINAKDGHIDVKHLVEYPTPEERTDKTLAYGASWCQAKELEGLAATCSFYDNLLSLWSYSHAT